MIVVFLIWILTFFVLSIFGISSVKLINKFPGLRDQREILNTDEYFFIGFLTLSTLTAIISIFCPIGGWVQLLFGIFTLALLLINYREITFMIRRSLNAVSRLKKPELVLLIFFVLFVLMAVVQKITWLDTQSYHVQNIQWIKKYPVVPGLGNLHDRFAFNSMFFVISSLFTFDISNVMIFPLNGICYIVLIIKLFALYKKENDQGVQWKAVFYILILLISLLIMIPNINTPSPDIICATLTIYIFLLIFEKSGGTFKFNYPQFILLNLSVFSCISFKLSSLFLIMTLLFFLDENVVKRALITLVVFILIISPFIIRNYFLSGYLIYPFPAIDIFNVDWKIPMDNVIETKSVIEAWAKIPVTPYPEVLNMKFSEWIFPWFKQLSFNGKLIVTVNFLSVFTLIIMFLRKDIFLAKIQIILLINLIFWFFKAPDPRFAYGIIFVGFSLTFAYLIKLSGITAFSEKSKYLKFILGCFLLIVITRRIMFPVGTLKDPSLWILPASFGKVETKDYFTNFHYHIPVNDQECFNTEIPCVTYPLNNVFLRGNDLSEGFKVVKVKE